MVVEGNNVTARGVEAEIRWGYHSAARLRDWSLERSGDLYHLSAQIVTSEDFRLSQQPLKFIIQRPTGAWRWPITSLQVAGGTLTAVLGPQE